MIEKGQIEKFWDNRDRFELTPCRYEEIVLKKSVNKMFDNFGRGWRANRDSISYLDLGCGDGSGTSFFSGYLRGKVGLPVRTWGVDGSGVCEVDCRQRGIDFLRLELGVESIPFVDCQVVSLFETIEHVFDTDSLLESVRGAISNDGLLLVTTLNVACLKNRVLVPLGLQPFNTEVSMRKLSYGYRFGFLRRRMDTWKPAGHIRPFTLYSLCDLLEDNGFRVIGSCGLENWRALKFLEHLSKNMCTGILVVATPK